MPTSRWRRRLAVASALMAATLVVLTATAWLLRDLPRRKLETALAERLGAEVVLGAFVLDGTQRFVLHDLVVTRMAGRDRLRRLSVGTLVVGGRPTELLAGRFALLEASAVEVRIGDPDPTVPEATEPAAEVVVQRFRLTGARVLVDSGGIEGTADVEADLTGIGGNLAGAVKATSDRLGFAQGKLGVEARSVAATAAFAQEGSGFAVHLRAAETILTRGDGNVTLHRSGLEADFLPVNEGRDLEFDAQASTAGIEAIRLRGTFDEKAGRLIEGRLALEGLSLEPFLPLVPGLPPGFEAAGTLDAGLVIEKDAPARWTLRGRIDHVDAPAGAGSTDRARAEGVTVEARGEAAIDRIREGGPIRASVSVRTLSGSVSGLTIPATVSPVTLEFDGRGSATDAPVVAGRVVVTNGVTGRLEADLDVATRDGAPVAAARWRLAATKLGALLDVAASTGFALPGEAAIVGTLTADGTAAWPASRGSLLSGRAVVDGIAASLAAAGRLDAGRVAVAFSWPSPDAAVALSRVVLEGTLVAPPVPTLPIRIAGSAMVDPSTPSVRNAIFEVASPNLFEASATGAWSPSSGGTFAVKLAQADLPRWQAFLEPLLGDVAPGYEVQGKTTVDVTGTIAGDLRWSGHGTAAIAKFGFTSDDGARVLEGLDTTWDVAVEGVALDRATARATARVRGFQVLWDSLFADFEALPSSLEASASVDATGERPAWSAELGWRYPDGPSLDARASGAGRGPVSFETTFAVDDLARTLEKYLRTPLGDSVPWFNRIEGDGALRVRAKGIAGTETVAVAGRVRLEDARIEGTKGFVEVAGLDLDLPFDLTWGAANAKGERSLSGPELSGSLGFEKLELGGLSLAATSTPLRIAADTIGLDEGLAVPLLGGVLGFEKLTLIEAFRPTRRAETAVLLWGLSLREAAAAFDLPPLDGTADGYFPAVTLKESSFEVKGGGEISVFGGRVKVGDISGEDVLTRFPKMRLSADFDAIDLKRLTGTFDFGDMTGIVRGYVHDLELFRGVPTAFNARLETIDTKGVRNKINVKAVNNIAILGTGGSVGILDRGIHKFIDQFTYDRIGIELRLENDVFMMRGLEQRRGKELFLKGRLPFPIDVVNAQPGRTVSFRSMLDRLSAVDFGGMSTR